MADIQLVGFHGDQVSTWKNEETGKVYCVPREIASGLGMSWGGQYQKLTKSPLYNKHLRCLDIETPGGKQEMLLLDVDYLPAWLASISLEKVHPSVHAKLLAYQEECAQAVRDYWMKGLAQNPRHTQALPSSTDQAITRLAEIMGIGYQQLQGQYRELAGETKSLAGETKSLATSVENLTTKQAQFEGELEALRHAPQETWREKVVPDGWETTLGWVVRTGKREDGWIPDATMAVFRSWCRSLYPKPRKYPVSGRPYPLEHWPTKVLKEAWCRANKQVCLFDHKKRDREAKQARDVS